MENRIVAYSIVAYSIVDFFHGLCIDKKSILLEQIEACERSLDYTESMNDLSTITGNCSAKDNAQACIVTN